MAAAQPTKVMGEELWKAANEGRTDEILRLWREHGDNLEVEFKDFFGRTPLHWAASKGHGEACRVLISTCGANVNSRDTWDNTPLMKAAAYNKLNCVEVLLELGADITLQDFGNKTALDHALGYAAVAALLEAAASPMVKSASKA